MRLKSRVRVLLSRLWWRPTIPLLHCIEFDTPFPVQTFDNVFDALADTPSEAANMKARAELLVALQTRIRSWDIPQEAAAARLGITRPRLNDLLRGKLGKFSLDALVNVATAAGLTLEIRIADAA
jgi:predicted XRE-type DNA-binding protein